MIFFIAIYKCWAWFKGLHKVTSYRNQSKFYLKNRAVDSLNRRKLVFITWYFSEWLKQVSYVKVHLYLHRTPALNKWISIKDSTLLLKFNRAVWRLFVSIKSFIFIFRINCFSLLKFCIWTVTNYCSALLLFYFW